VTRVTADVDVVIVTYDAAAVIGDCLGALHDGTARIRTIVADNDSRDRTVAIVCEAGVEVHQMGSNAGFGAACNAGAALGTAPTILFLNPDARVSGADVVLAARAMSELDAAILGVRLVQADGTFDHAAKRMVVRPWDAFKFLVRRSPGSTYVAPHVDEFEAGIVDSVNGAFLMIERAAFERIGGFDESFWMYLEDVDLCRRVTDRGGKVWYWPGVSAVHLKGAITGRSRAARLNYHFHRSMWTFYRKHQAASDGLAARALVLAGILGRGGWVTCRDMVRRRRGIGVPLSASDDS